MHVLCWPYGMQSVTEIFIVFELKMSGEQIVNFFLHRSVPKFITLHIIITKLTEYSYVANKVRIIMASRTVPLPWSFLVGRFLGVVMQK